MALYVGENPVAEKISQHIVNLPNHPGIDEEYRDKVSAFVRRNRSLVYSSYEDALKSNNTGYFSGS